jgi:hypothetical protein
VILTVKITLTRPLKRIVSRERCEKVSREFEARCNKKKVKQIIEEVVQVYKK